MLTVGQVVQYGILCVVQHENQTFNSFGASRTHLKLCNEMAEQLELVFWN